MIIAEDKNVVLWGDIFGDQVVASAMIDRIVHHAEVITLQRLQLLPQKPPNRIPALDKTGKQDRIFSSTWLFFSPQNGSIFDQY